MHSISRLITILFFLCAPVFSGITRVQDPIVLQPGSSPVDLKSSVYALKDSPLGIDTPRISFQLTVMLASAPKPANTTLTAQVLLFHSSRWYEVGIREGLRSNMCCTKKIYDQGSCKEKGAIIYTLSSDHVLNGETLYHWPLVVPANGSSVDYSFSIVPANSGVWYVYIGNCDMEGRPFSFSGSVSFKSPYGYIPANSFPHMVIYFTVGGLFLVLFGFWVVWVLRYRVNIQFYQHGISLLIMLSIAEEVFWGWEYISYNSNGLPTFGILVPAVILTALKLSWIRVLLLLIGLGFRVTTPLLSFGLTLGLIFVTVFYFAVSVAEAYLNVDSLFGVQIIPLASGVNKGFLVVLNIVFILWVLASTVGSMTTCKTEKQMEKYNMYRRILIVFGTITVTSSIFYFVEIGITASYVADASWRTNWLLRTYWDCIYLLATIFLCYIWRPAPDNNRYAYGAQNLRDDTGLNLGGPSVKKPAGKKSKSKKGRKGPPLPREVTLDDSTESSSD